MAESASEILVCQWAVRRPPSARSPRDARRGGIKPGSSPMRCATSGSGGLLFELPFDVVVEAGLGFLLCLVGALVGAGKMEPARSTSGLTDTTFDFHMNRADFNLFNHRGAALRARLRSGNA